MRLFATAALLVLAVAPATARSPKRDPEAELARLLKGRTAEAPVSCLHRFGHGESSTTIDGVGVLFQSGGKMYLNRFEGGCPQLTSDRILITSTPTGDLCRGDIARIVTQTPSAEVGTCALGPFTPYSQAR